MKEDAESFVNKYASPTPGEGAAANVHPISGELQCFGVAQENRSAPPMLVLRARTGDERALMYSYLVDIDFNPSQGIVLRFVNRKVTLKGRHLRAIFQRLVDHRVAWVQEVDETTVEDETATAVSTIEIAEI